METRAKTTAAEAVENTASQDTQSGEFHFIKAILQRQPEKAKPRLQSFIDQLPSYL